MRRARRGGDRTGTADISDVACRHARCRFVRDACVPGGAGRTCAALSDNKETPRARRARGVEGRSRAGGLGPVGRARTAVERFDSGPDRGGGHEETEDDDADCEEHHGSSALRGGWLTQAEAPEGRSACGRSEATRDARGAPRCLVLDGAFEGFALPGQPGRREADGRYHRTAPELRPPGSAPDQVEATLRTTSRAMMSRMGITTGPPVSRSRELASSRWCRFPVARDVRPTGVPQYGYPYRRRVVGPQSSARRRGTSAAAASACARACPGERITIRSRTLRSANSQRCAGSASSSPA